jgi:hypothetical protein
MDVSDDIRVSAKLTVKVRSYLSIAHIQAAALFSRNCARIEKEYDGTFSNELYSEHRSYVIGTVLSTVSFLEATINEFLADCLDSPDGAIVETLDATTKNLLAGMWKDNIVDKMNGLEKFQIVLAIARKNQLDSSASIYQNADSLIKLRNALVHYKPAWIESSQGSQDQKTAHKLEKLLRGKFSLNPLAGTGKPYYPDRCLSYGRAKWAVGCSLRFIEEFYSNLGMSYCFQAITSSLETG